MAGAIGVAFGVVVILIQLALFLWFISMIARFVRAVETMAENSAGWVAPQKAQTEMTADEVMRTQES